MSHVELMWGFAFRWLTACSAAGAQRSRFAGSLPFTHAARRAVASASRRQWEGRPAFIHKVTGLLQSTTAPWKRRCAPSLYRPPPRNGGGWYRGAQRVDEEIGGGERNRNCLVQNRASRIYVPQCSAPDSARFNNDFVPIRAASSAVLLKRTAWSPWLYRVVP